jgi:S-formylglutathione hydrolase
MVMGELVPPAFRAQADSGTEPQGRRRKRHEGYDHSYWFIQSFIEDHLKWHADRLCV